MLSTMLFSTSAPNGFDGARTAGLPDVPGAEVAGRAVGLRRGLRARGVVRGFTRPLYSPRGPETPSGGPGYGGLAVRPGCDRQAQRALEGPRNSRAERRKGPGW